MRGESAGFLRVYDHRHERPGYIRPTQVRVYRVGALEELYKLATMNLDPLNAALMVVQKDACVKILGTGPMSAGDSEISAVLQELAQRYQESAPRVSKLRVELEISRGAGDEASLLPDTAASEIPPAPTTVGKFLR